MELDVVWIALLYALGVALLFKVMKRERGLQDATYEALSLIAALLAVVAVLLYHILQKI
jgi:hypothetical protein